MTESAETNNARVSENTGKWLGWLGIIIGVIGFWWQPIYLGIVAVLSGGVSVFSNQKVLAGAAIIIGLVAIVIGIFR